MDRAMLPHAKSPIGPTYHTKRQVKSPNSNAASDIYSTLLHRPSPWKLTN